VVFDPNSAARRLLGDLDMRAEVVSESSARVRIPVTPLITGPDQGVRAGVLAILVDVVAGSAVLRSLVPDWMATADLTLQVVRPAVGPYVDARANLLRRGRTTLVVEVLVFDVDDDWVVPGGPIDSGEPGPLVAWATLTFAVLPSNGRPVPDAVFSDLPHEWALSGPGLDGPIDQVLGISVDDAAAGLISLPVHEYLHNSFGAVQGGVMAMLGEVAAAEMLRSADPEGRVPVVTGLQVTYLALGRVGPIVTRTTLLDDGTGPFGGTAVVELIDEGAGERLTTVINVRAAPSRITSELSR
jgi:uncharacterized protein (TIGR00369 family)